MALIASIVARNETDRYLEPVLRRLSSQVDDIVFTDDASTDDTVAVAKKFTDNVYEMDKPTFIEDEYALRSTAWENLSAHAEVGDWILAIDADEMLFYPSEEYLKMLLNQREYPVLGITFYHMWDEKNFRIDKAWRPAVSQRLFRFEENGTFRNRRLACGAEPQYVFNHVVNRRWMHRTELSMKHLGYMRDADKVAKYERYMNLDGGDFHSLSHLKSIIDPTPTVMRWPFE